MSVEVEIHIMKVKGDVEPVRFIHYFLVYIVLVVGEGFHIDLVV
jgi:hypothetical protein